MIKTKLKHTGDQCSPKFKPYISILEGGGENLVIIYNYMKS